jgi:GntR family transcriptional repressor for pyruvate dehydrogenase complex
MADPTVSPTRDMPQNAATQLVVDHVRQLLVRGELRKGQRLPPERDLVAQLGVSRTSVRAGLQALATKGVLVIRHGAGTFVSDGPLVLDSEQFHFLSALHGFKRGVMFEARRALEARVARMAAERATGDDLAAISDAVTGMFASLGDSQVFLEHDARFHRAVAVASGNPILASIVEMVAGMFFEVRRGTAHRNRELQPVAEKHRLIYQAIRSRDGALAEERMVDHLLDAERLQEEEAVDAPAGLPAGSPIGSGAGK